MLVRLWQVSGTVRAVSRRLRALVDTHCETALEPLRQILRPLCSDAVVERLARTGDDRKGLFARALDSAVRRVGKIARVTPSHIARARFCPRVDAHETRGQRRARLRACGGRVFAPFAHPSATVACAECPRARAFYAGTQVIERNSRFDSKHRSSDEPATA